MRECLDELRTQVVGRGLRRDLTDRREELAREVDRLAQLVDKDGGRPSADVEGGEVVAQPSRHVHLFAQVGEVVARPALLVQEPVERAVGAQTLAERHVRVEHVPVARLRCRQALHASGAGRQVAAVEDAENGGDAAFGQHGWPFDSWRDRWVRRAGVRGGYSRPYLRVRHRTPLSLVASAEIAQKEQAPLPGLVRSSGPAKDASPSRRSA